VEKVKEKEKKGKKEKKEKEATLTERDIQMMAEMYDWYEINNW